MSHFYRNSNLNASLGLVFMRISCVKWNLGSFLICFHGLFEMNKRKSEQISYIFAFIRKVEFLGNACL